MIYTVTFNPSIDYIARTEHFTIGATNRIVQEEFFPGGKGINVSIVLKNLLVPTKALGFTAGFTGEQIETLLLQKQVETDFIRLRQGNSRINVKIKAESETELNGMGPVIAEEELHVLLEKLKAIQPEDYLVLAGNVPKGVSKDIYGRMADIVGPNVRVVVDAERELLLPVLQRKPFLIKPNRRELEDIFEVTLHHTEEIIFYGRKLQEMGARNVLISLGGAGAILLSEENTIYRAGAPKGEVVNSVGAGDSMVAGFLAGICRQETMEKAFLFAIAAGSVSTFSRGLADRKSVEEMMKVCYTF